MSALVETVRNMNRMSAMVLLGLASLLIVGFIIMALRMTTAAMTPLYTGLTLEDSSRIISELEKNNTPYEIAANGSQIMVPSDRVLRMRMTLASQGIPATGSIVGYEIFDRSDTLGSSNFVMNINMMRALEGELARTIGAISNVENARVHLVFAKREIFSREKDKPTASVTIKMRGGKALDKSEVQSITHLVASAVPGLEASRVTVVDNHGKLLARGDGDSAEASVSRMQEQRIEFETHMQEKLEEMIEKVIGTGKVRVQINADLNFDRIVTNSEKYDPDGQVARSVQSNSERANNQEKTPKDNVSVTGNLPPSSAGDGASSTQISEQAVETTNFEISKTVQNHISEGGNVKRLSVAVLVDGTYIGDDEKYEPRTEDELKQIRSLVASAMGYDEKRGDRLEVVNMRFTTETFKAEEESVYQKFKFEAQSIIQTLIIAVVAILAILLVLRPAVTQLIKQSQSASSRMNSEMAAIEGGGGNARLTGGGGAGMVPGVGGSGGSLGGNLMGGGGGDGNDSMIDVANIRGGMRASSMKKVNEIIDKYPDETMGVIRGWMQSDS